MILQMSSQERAGRLARPSRPRMRLADDQIERRAAMDDFQAFGAVGGRLHLIAGFAQYTRYLWPGMTGWQSRAVMIGVGVLTMVLLYRRISAIGKIAVTFSR